MIEEKIIPTEKDLAKKVIDNPKVPLEIREMLKARMDPNEPKVLVPREACKNAAAAADLGVQLTKE